MQAYDLELLPRAAERGSAENHGWCFGLPPGITSEQWPLDPNNGYPLMHGFTLLLPQDYRVHGPEIVALSFFATASDQNDGGPSCTGAIMKFFEQPGDEPPADLRLLPFWQSVQDAHPRMHRMEDILGCAYAVILLTQEEFDGPLCLPPQLTGNDLLDETPAPAWMTKGSAMCLWNNHYSPSWGKPVEEYFVWKIMGQVPEEWLAFHRALRWTPRAEDPNAGVVVGDPAYQQEYYWLDDKVGRENYREHAWAAGHKRDHIGGTMRPVQSAPAFSPFYVGFEEYFGGYNFGGGNGQLDFRDMKFDWACG